MAPLREAVHELDQAEPEQGREARKDQTRGEVVDTRRHKGRVEKQRGESGRSESEAQRRPIHSSEATNAIAAIRTRVLVHVARRLSAATWVVAIA